MSASVRDESGIFVDFHFSEGGDLEFWSTFLRFRESRARDAVWMVRVCAGGEVFHHEVTKTRREGTKKGMGLGGKVGERQLTAEIATLRLAEPRSGRRSAGGRGERQLDWGVGPDKARRGPGGLGVPCFEPLRAKHALARWAIERAEHLRGVARSSCFTQSR